MAITANFGWIKPAVAGDNGAWGTIANTLYDAVDAVLFAVQTVANAALSRAGGVMTGRLDAKTLTTPKQALGVVSGMTFLDCTSSHYFTLTVGGGITISPANVPLVANTLFGILIKITNGGSAAIVWPGVAKWPSGSAPALTVAGTDMVALLSDDGGVTFQAFLVAKDLR